MRFRTPLLLVAVVMVVAAPVASAGGVVPNPVLNGDFELYVPSAIGDSLAGTPADECIGIGHQAYYGDESWQHKLIDEEDPEAAAGQVTGDPEGEATFFAGYGHCVFSAGDGYDLVWLNARNTAAKPATHWSMQDNSPVVFADADEDGDREATILADGSLAGHNFWQAFSSPFQAFTGNFDALEFDVEAGAIAAGALVQVSLSATPMEAQNDRVATALDCGLNFRGRDLLEHVDEDGHVAMDPTDAQFFSRHASCDALVAAWSEGDADARRRILGRTRIVQLSFWSFNRGVADEACACAVRIDNVSLSNATSPAEEVVLHQNVNLGG